MARYNPEKCLYGGFAAILLLILLINCTVLYWTAVSSSSSFSERLPLKSGAPDYYTVIDHYANGDQIERGKAPINTRFSSQLNSSNPLGTNITRLVSGDELVFIGAENTNINRSSNWVMDDENASFAVLGEWDTELGNSPDVTTGDVNGDGLDEIITKSSADKNNTIRIWNNSKGNFEEIYQLSVYDPSWDPSWRHTRSEELVGAGDFDADDYAEICITGWNGSEYFFAVRDDALNNYEQVFFDTIEIGYEDNLQIDTGDVDGDGASEVVVAGLVDGTYAKIYIYDCENGTDWTRIKEFTVSVEFTVDTRVDVELGDFDGDGLDELIIATWYVRIYDDARANFQLLDTLAINGMEFKIAAGRFQHSYKDDFLFFAEFYWVDYPIGSWHAKTEVQFYELDNYNNIQLLARYNALYIWRDIWSPRVNLYLDAVFAELDQDGREEVVLTIKQSDDLTIKQSDDKFWLKILDDFEEGLQELKSEQSDSDSVRTVVAVGDFDGDSITAKYQNHYTSISNPYIMVAMAAAPTMTGINQNYGFSQTIYGTAISQSSSTENGYEISVGAIVTSGFNLFGLVETSVKVKVEGGFGKTQTHTKTTTTSTEYASSYDDNYVIFEIVLYDHYVYEILTHRNESFIGENFTICVPNTPTVYKWSVSYFNQNNDDAPDISNETFSHTVGQPWTYLSEPAKSSLVSTHSDNGSWTCPQAITVGQATETGGYNHIGIDLSDESVEETHKRFGVEIEALFGGGKTKFGFSLGFEHSWVYAVGLGKNTAYQGRVGDIVGEDWATYHYKFGLFVYNYHRSKSSKYSVIDYWVEDYNGPHENPTTTTSSATTSSVSSSFNFSSILPTTFADLGTILGTLGATVLILCRRRRTHKTLKET
ncbi:MAG: FG-GAP repeat domain-containing protein [Candidatus Hodarchaeota archaeon]